MMYSVRVSSALEDRLDAGFYNPAALAVVDKIRSAGRLRTLGNAILDGYRVVYHGIDRVSGGKAETSIPFLSPTQIDQEGAIDFDSADRVPAYYSRDYPKGVARAGELLVEVKGNVSKVAVVPDAFPHGLMISGSLYKAILREGDDSRFVLAFLKSAHGQVLKNRLTSNTIIDYIAKDALYSIPLPSALPLAQRYIGDKVRQAERLRTQALELEARVAKIHTNYILPPVGIDFGRHTRRLPSRDLTERLDAHFYPAAVEQYLKQVGGQPKPLEKLTSLVTNGHTQPEAEVGVLQATVTNLGRSFLGGELRTVERPSDDSRMLSAHDLLLCNAAHNKSYIGRDVTYCQTDVGIYPSTEVMVLRVDREQVPASFIRHYLKSQIGFLQIQSTIRGISAHSYPGDVKLIKVPLPNVPAGERAEWFATDDRMLRAGHCVDMARLLTDAATQFVELLVEGKLSEADFVAAQTGLESGDQSGDRALLQTLRRSGNGDRSALFIDLDALYVLLEKPDKAGGVD